MAAPPVRALSTDNLRQILLLLPPGEPEHLIRSALVSKEWLNVTRDPGFRRRYREFHGAPPLLGLLHRITYHHGTPPARFASTTSMPEFPYPGPGGHPRPLDCRHGRVLVKAYHREGHYHVWDPVTGDRHYLPPQQEEIKASDDSAAVLCAADGCDHLDCHGGPFRVVYVASTISFYEDRKDILATVYSSKTGVWSVPVCVDMTSECYVRHLLPKCCTYRPHLEHKRGTFVRDALYFTISAENTVIKYDLLKDRLTMIDPPPPSNMDKSALMAMEDGTSLGFACVQGSSLYTWSRKVDTDEEYAEWVQYKIIELDETIPVGNPDRDDDPFVVGFAEGVGSVFVSSGVGLFTIKLSSGQIEKVAEPGAYYSVLPYMSFYLPEIGNGGGDDATDIPHNA